MATWSFLTNHARALVCIAHDPGVRLRDIATSLGITERSAHGIVSDLVGGGYVHKTKDGRRNRYQIQEDLSLGETLGQGSTIGEMLNLLVEADERNSPRSGRSHRPTGPSPHAAAGTKARPPSTGGRSGAVA